MMESMLLWSLVPAFLVFLGGMLVKHAWPGPEGRPNFAFYLLAVAAVILTLNAAVSLLIDPTGTTQTGRAVIILLPAAVGALGFLLFHLRDLGRLSPVLRVASLLFILLSITAVILQFPRYFEHVIPAVFALVLALWLARSGGRLILIFSLLFTAFLIFINSGGMESLFEIVQRMGPGAWVLFPLMILFLATSPMMVGLAAALVYRATRSTANSSENRSVVLKAGHLLLAAILLGYLAYTIFWTSVWDQTSDGLGGLFITYSGTFTAVAASIVLAFALNGWRRLFGAAFGVLGTLLLLFSFNQGWQVSYQGITENRAGRIEHALDRYFAAQGSYPVDLSALTPRYLLSIPEPVILRNVGWCYRSGGDYYQLGTYHREFFGMPTSFRLYAQSGPAPDWACEEKLDFVEARYPAAPMFTGGDPSQFGPPTPEPLPQSQPGIGRQPLEPFFSRENIQLGRWSEDGRYLSFGVSGGEAPFSTHLYLYDALSDEVCRTGEAYIRPWSFYSQHAWLPSGSILYIDAVGRPYVLEPCQPGHTDLTDLFGEAAPQRWREEVPGAIPATSPMMVYDPAKGKALIQVEDRFWMLDAEQVSAEVLEGVTPNSFEAHWDNAVFSPSGERLAVSRLNAREGRDGATLYIIDMETLQILLEKRLPYASRQSAPWIRWLNEFEITLGSENEYNLLDLRSDPPVEIKIIGDIFGLGLQYPSETHSSTAVQLDDGTYRLGLRANHPRNQAIYIYSSATGQVQTYNYDEDVLLIFDGGSSWLTHFENAAENRYNHFVLWPDQPEQEPVLIEVEGHSPRSYAHLRLILLPERGLVVFSSSQGVSLHDIHNGQPLAFYGLEDDQGSIEIYGSAAPDEGALVVLADRGGLYRIPLP
jgi:hypothetical protein